MIRVDVDSSSVRAIGYSAVSQDLEIEFRSGEVYRYLGVGPDVHAGLLLAASKGKYVNGVIKKHFQYCRVGGGARE